MNTRILAFGWALIAAGCGGENNSAREPASGTMQPAANTNTSVGTTPVVTPGARDVKPTRTDQSANVTPSDVPSTTSTTSTTATSVVNNPSVADQTKKADNTTINERDRHGTLTPLDQGNSAAETKITATIRKGIIAEKNLSFNAKNVKVITVGNKVTLRGPVASDQERSMIEALAKQTAGVGAVDNQLEVKK